MFYKVRGSNPNFLYILRPENAIVHGVNPPSKGCFFLFVPLVVDLGWYEYDASSSWSLIWGSPTIDTSRCYFCLCSDPLWPLQNTYIFPVRFLFLLCFPFGHLKSTFKKPGSKHEYYGLWLLQSFYSSANLWRQQSTRPWDGPLLRICSVSLSHLLDLSFSHGFPTNPRISQAVFPLVWF